MWNGCILATTVVHLIHYIRRWHNSLCTLVGSGAGFLEYRINRRTVFVPYSGEDQQTWLNRLVLEAVNSRI